MATKIEWCDETVNPITGCTQISPGCKNCYAKKIAESFRGKPGYDSKNPFKVQFHEDKLKIPLKWNRTKRIFMVSMGDIFHQHVPDEWIDKIFLSMNQVPHHKYLILTKRPLRMFDYCKNYFEKHEKFPKCVWLGVTAEDQQRANERLPLLLETPAYHHFVSVEPMLEPVKLLFNGKYKLDWVIVGGEKAGDKARFMEPDWARDVRDQCKATNTPFFFKQMTNERLIPDDLNIKEFPAGL